MTDYTDADKLEWLKFELKDRRRIYPDMVKKNQITQKNMKQQLAMLEAIVEDYRREVDAMKPPLDDEVA